VTTEAADHRLRHLADLAREVAPIIDRGIDPLDVALALNAALVRLGASTEPKESKCIRSQPTKT
jgi:hypothetical protein